MTARKKIGTIGKKNFTIVGEAQKGRVKFSRSNGSVSIQAEAIRNAPVKNETVAMGNGATSQRCEEILAFIESHRKTFNVSPSQRDIQKHFGFASQNTVQRAMASLQAAGKLVRNVGNSMARGSVPIAEFSDDHAIKNAIALLRKNGYSVALKKTAKRKVTLSK